MPTPEEIKKIARLFAYETSNGDALDPHIDFAEEFAVEVLQWLSKKFCIVPKEVAFKEYEDATTEGKHSHVKHQIQSRTRLRQLKRLFGKSLFNEEKQVPQEK